MSINLLPLVLTLSLPATADDFAEQLSDYFRSAANMRWSEARQIPVQNPAAVDDTIAVVVPVTGRHRTAFVVVDESAVPVVTQSDDLDGNGTVNGADLTLLLGAWS